MQASCTLYWLMYSLVLLVLCCLLYRCSSADCCTAAPLLLMYCWSFNDWCTAGPLLIYVLLLLFCWCTAGPLMTDVLLDSAGPLLTDVPQVLCRLLYRCSSAADVLLVFCRLMYCWKYLLTISYIGFTDPTYLHFRKCISVSTELSVNVNLKKETEKWKLSFVRVGTFVNVYWIFPTLN